MEEQIKRNNENVKNIIMLLNCYSIYCHHNTSEK